MEKSKRFLCPSCGKPALRPPTIKEDYICPVTGETVTTEQVEMAGKLRNSYINMT